MYQYSIFTFYPYFKAPKNFCKPLFLRLCNVSRGGVTWGEIGLDLQTVPGTNAIPQEHLPSKKLKAGSRITF